MIKELLLSIGQGWIFAVLGLLILMTVLAAAWHDLTYRTVRIYNWDGGRYRFLGRERLRRENDAYVVAMRERMGEVSRTTRYLILASAGFVKRHRYENLLLRAGAVEVWLPIGERMRADVLYAHRLGGGRGISASVRKESANGHNQLVHDREK